MYLRSRYGLWCGEPADVKVLTFCLSGQDRKKTCFRLQYRQSSSNSMIDPIPNLKTLLNDGKSLPIENYPKKYPANIAIQYSGIRDFKRVFLSLGNDPTHIDSFITSATKFFRRNHFLMPDIDMAQWCLNLDGCFQQPAGLAMEDIMQFKPVSRVSVMECTGNQRFEKGHYGKQTTAFIRESTYNKLLRLLDPFQFPITIKLIISIIRGMGLTGGNLFDNGVFTGVKLFDVLEAHPLREDARQLVFEGLDTGYDMLVQRMQKRKIHYARSIDIRELKQYEPILCYAMDGKPLSKSHGGPLRLIIPGMYGAEQVKWLGRIQAIPQDFTGYFQKEYYGYKIDGKTVPVHEQRPKSMVIKVLKKNNCITAFGVAWRGLSPISKVEVSTDGMQTWAPAHLLCREIDHSWLFWKYDVSGNVSGSLTFYPRVTCENGDQQPLNPGQYSTVYGNNAVISATVRLDNPWRTRWEKLSAMRKAAK